MDNGKTEEGGVKGANLQQGFSACFIYADSPS